MEHKMNMKDQNTKAFVLAGNALFTVESATDNTRFTYKVNKSEDGKVWFVSLLTGPNNESDYKYICYFRDDMIVKVSQKSAMRYKSEPVSLFRYLLKQMNSGIQSMFELSVYHSGKCGRCGRTLTTPRSIELGFGPECVKWVLGGKL